MYDVTPYTSGKSTACGPTCLKMLLEYYGVTVDLDQLIEECGVAVDGCSAADLNRVGRAHGLDMKTFKMTPDELIRQDRPAIVWWKYYHFLVFCGQSAEGDIVLCNPSMGRYTIDKGTFAALYSGISLWNGSPEDAVIPPTTPERVAELETALVEVAEMTAEHDDAIVELAGLIGEEG